MKHVLTLFLFAVLAVQVCHSQDPVWMRDTTTFPTLMPVSFGEKPIDYDTGWLAFQTNNVVEVYSYDAATDFQKWGELTPPNPAHTDFGKAIAIDETHLAISSGDVVYAYEYDGTNWGLVNTLTTPTEVADNNGFKPNDRLELDHDLLVVASPNWMTAKSTGTPYVSLYSWNTNTWGYEDSYPMTFIHVDSVFFPGDFCECVSWPGTIGSHCDLAYIKGGTITISDNHIFAGNATLNALPLIISNSSGTWEARIPHLDFLKDNQGELFVELTDSVLQEVYALHPQMHLLGIVMRAASLILQEQLNWWEIRSTFGRMQAVAWGLQLRIMWLMMSEIFMEAIST